VIRGSTYTTEKEGEKVEFKGKQTTKKNGVKKKGGRKKGKMRRSENYQ